MKQMKKLASLLLALVMIFSMTTTVFAAGETGSITIDNAVEGIEYKIYRVFDLEVDSTASPTAYKYTLNKNWIALKDYSTTIDDKTVSAADFFTVDPTDGHIIWNAEMNNVTGAASFAKLLDAYQKANSNSVADDGNKTANSSTVSFTELPLGYYFVQTSLGALCSLDTTNPDATIKEKNSKPSVDKQVEEDSNKKFGDKNDAQIGQTVNFKTTINVVDGDPTGYVLHDKMSAGLTFDPDSVKVYKNGSTTPLETGYTVKSGDAVADGCTFDVVFDNATLAPNDVIVVTYSATLNENAVVGGAGNPNETWLDYGENNTTDHDFTKTYTWELPIYKYTGEGENKKPLPGAEFVLYYTENDTTYYAVTGAATDGNVYKITGWTTNEAEATKLVSDAQGNIKVEGLDEGVYYLKETKAPAGYNKLNEPVEVEIVSDGNSGTPNKYSDGNLENNLTQTGYKQNSTDTDRIEVQNKTGSELPSTGGIGTTIFYVVGSILLIGAAVLLITRKRMNAAEK